MYPNGISTALPQNVQDQYLRSIAGFESVSIIRYGYAIEYQHLDPRMLYHTLEYKKISGLFFAVRLTEQRVMKKPLDEYGSRYKCGFIFR